MEMGAGMTVPVGWLFAVGGLLLAAFAWWLQTEWARNWEEHKAFRKDLAAHNEKVERDVRRVHHRLDWLIQHSNAPNYPTERDREDDL